MPDLDRRSFIATTTAASIVGLHDRPAAAAPRPAAAAPRPTAAGPVVISSGNGLRAVERAMERLHAGIDAAEAVVDGVTIVEDDPKDMSVGYGGLPNEDGVVQLDASVMHGPMHKAGAVAAIEGIRNPARVALEVLRRTDHVLLVGEGAKRFALALGFEEQNMLTEQAREAWLRWKRNRDPKDDWLDDDQLIAPAADHAAGEAPSTWGTIHCAAVDANGDLGACTTTSGLSYKIPGRVGDSPIIGAGMFVDNEVGSAGATGRGESAIQSCGAFQVVRYMAEGDDPETACRRTLEWVARHTKRPDLLDDRGRPRFQVTFYALRKDGAFGCACMRGGTRFAVHDGTEARHVKAPALFER